MKNKRTYEVVEIESPKQDMFGAAPYLAEAYKLDISTARDILSNWMKNYSEIAEKYYK